MTNPLSSWERSIRLAIAMPLRDDWKSASVLIRQLDRVLRSQSCVADVLLVDDSSQEGWERVDFQGEYSAIRSIRTLRLRLNLGHQRAIAIGLVHIFQTAHCDAVLVMDSDGEDTAEGVSQLLEAFRQDHGAQPIFAERSRRSESFMFRRFYGAYTTLFRLLTGLSIRIGNFSILPAAHLNTLVVQPELWNHYAASVLRSRRPFRMIPIPRGKRIAGSSRMNLAALVTHGLSAISVFADIVATRVLIMSSAGLLLAAGAMLALTGIRSLTHLVIPEWVTYVSGILVVILGLFVTIAAVSSFRALSDRSNLGFVPVRDCSLFAAEQADIYAP